jgi:hypothetical protein
MLATGGEEKTCGEHGRDDDGSKDAHERSLSRPRGEGNEKMATWRDVRRIALALPDTAEKNASGDSPTWTVHGKSFAWERPLRKSDLAELGKDAPTGAILGVRTADLEMKEALLAANPRVFFTTSHFDGYPAVLVILAKISASELRSVLVESWLARAPKRAAAAFLTIGAPKTR